jgi:hypothetical protein
MTELSRPLWSIFLDQLEKVNRVFETGITVNEMVVQVLPLAQPATSPFKRPPFHYR